MTKNAVRREKFQRIQRELSASDIEWMARRGELLTPRPTPVDDPSVTSHLYGPALKTVQYERVNVIYDHEEVTVQ